MGSFENNEIFENYQISRYVFRGELQNSHCIFFWISALGLRLSSYSSKYWETSTRRLIPRHARQKKVK